LQKAVDQFPDKKVPQDREERIELVLNFGETTNEVWKKLDDEFYEYQDDLDTLNLNFVRQHKADF